MNDAKLAGAQALAQKLGRDLDTLSDDARAIFIDLADTVVSAAAAPKKAAEPEPRIRVLRGFVEIWTVKDGKRGVMPYPCGCLAEARKITAGWARGSDWQPGSGLPIVELESEAPEPRDGDASGHYICSILKDENGWRVFQKLRPEGHPQPEDWSAQWYRERANQVSY